MWNETGSDLPPSSQRAAGSGLAFNISGVGDETSQGIGSISIIDSTISGVGVGVLANSLPISPNIMLDNTKVTDQQRRVYHRVATISRHAAIKGYFKNVWAWVGDHDNDQTIVNQPACSLPFVVLRWRLGALCPPSGARSVFMGHIQTESPYYQPNPRPPDTVRAGARFPNDPDFSGCDLAAAVEEDQCNYVWSLLVIDSTDVMVHSASLYSFFNEYYQDCIASHNCQTRILEVKCSTCVIIFTLFSIAIVNITGGINGTKVLQRITSVASPPSNYATSFEYGGFGPTTIGGSTTTVFITLTTTVDGIRIGYSTATPLPAYTNWPPVTQIIPKDRRIDKPEPDDRGVHVPCTARSIRPGAVLEPKCETKTADKACTWTTYMTGGETKSRTSACETITGCSLTESHTEVIGKQTVAPVGNWIREHRPTTTLGAAYTNSVYAAMMARLARDESLPGGCNIPRYKRRYRPRY
ncbi:hypothetical protein G3M48_004182 [Beauveria asiatica]|uniref:Uncharacterized protein n=1 Tax=Beauveria asiatica TaxID=1069075 RepID=A0AAW0RUM9_9HYPO